MFWKLCSQRFPLRVVCVVRVVRAPIDAFPGNTNDGDSADCSAAFPQQRLHFGEVPDRYG